MKISKPNQEAHVDDCVDDVEVYIRGPGWPSTDDPPNPWSRQYWNLTEQGQTFKRDKDKADRLARAAGHKDALSARIANAK